jgi:hypothetical protein
MSDKTPEDNAFLFAIQQSFNQSCFSPKENTESIQGCTWLLPNQGCIIYFESIGIYPTIWIEVDGQRVEVPSFVSSNETPTKASEVRFVNPFTEKKYFRFILIGVHPALGYQKLVFFNPETSPN